MATAKFRLTDKRFLPSGSVNVNTFAFSGKTNSEVKTVEAYWLTDPSVKDLHHDPKQAVTDKFVKVLKRLAPQYADKVIELIAELGGRKTNANEYPLPTLVIDEGFSRFVWQYVKEKPLINPNALKAHAIGDIYWHKLPAGFILPYCNGNDVTEVLEKGLWTPVVVSKPPKHFISAVDQTKEFLLTMQAHWTGAQGTDNVQLHWAPYVEADKVDDELIEQITQSFLFTINMPMRTGGQCFDKDTLILTAEGWKGYNEVKEGDLIWTVNLKTMKLELKPVRKVFIWPKEVWEKQGIVRIKSRSVDIIVTRNHRVIWKHWNSKEEGFRFNKIGEIIEKYKKSVAHTGIIMATPAASTGKDGEQMFTPDEALLLGLILADGWFENHKGTLRIGISQSPKKYADLIKQLLEKLNIEYKVFVKERKAGRKINGVEVRSDSITYEFRLSSKNEFVKKVKQLIGEFKHSDEARKKLIVALANKLPSDLLRKVLIGMAYGDGDSPRLEKYLNGKSKTFTIHVSKDIAPYVVMIATLAGYNVSMQERERTYLITISETKTEVVKVEEDPEYDDIVWSVNTENETVIAWKPGQTPLLTGNSVFINWAVTGVEGKLILDEKQPVLPGGKRGKPGDYWGYLDTSRRIMKAMLKNMMKGDGRGATLTFPVSTIYVSPWGKNMKWLEEDPEMWELFWKLEATRGPFYFLNTRIIDPNSVLAMCCRMTQNKAETIEAKKVNRGGVFSLPSKVGSLNIATVNFPRIALKAKGDKEKAMEMVEEEVRKLANWLLEHRRIIEAMYYSDIMTMVRKYFTFQEYANYFSTVGVIGLPEFALLLTDYDWTVWGTPENPPDKGALTEVTWIMVEALKRARKVIEEISEEENVSMNLEQVPAETAATKLLRQDWSVKEWREEIKRVLKPDSTGQYETVAAYSNFNTPSWAGEAPPDYALEALWTIAWVESKTQPLYTGGVMKHFFVAEEWDTDQLAKFVNQLLALGDSEGDGLVYFSWSPPSWACENGHKGVGFFERCPVCGAPATVRVRIVGWNTDPRRFSPGRFNEMKNRVWLKQSGQFTSFFWDYD